MFSARFQFPSNGKAYLNLKLVLEQYAIHEFQFPSNGKAYLNTIRTPKPGREFRFNSLQTGKRIWTEAPTRDWGHGLIAFQFPSNGKAYLNMVRGQKTRDWVHDFNSLQTGKRIWTDAIAVVGEISNDFVSIPFKRESVSERSHGVAKYTRGGSKFQFPSNGKAYLNVKE